jgi:hypothetical protein
LHVQQARRHDIPRVALERISGISHRLEIANSQERDRSRS